MKTFIEHDNEIVLDEAVKYHVDNEIPLTQSVFRMYSENFFKLFKRVRELYEEGKYMPQAEDGIRDFCLSRGLGDVYKRQLLHRYQIHQYLYSGTLPLQPVACIYLLHIIL